ncbi:hypothetical protein [Candidatus Rhabdochlamydia porcellionis]|jgi:hypothetical protein|uniref:DUF1003 domain-containing protein n=1 Tax=Candidatus Rhabdochlamydia porcellionis TaxID=225148 RepID=A0ABX8YZ89_9BACT|nr:hypothetical protein [Candidatus Rhabdochlamydia porcellionis]QZA58665.1 hypothetical protein RHAB15C_0000543 [Candidatus Rhabdochlamydia porcellionis]
MSEVSLPSFQALFEKSSLIPSSKVEVNASSKIPQTHFEKSSLAPSMQIETEKSSKPQLPPSFSPCRSYQTLLVKHAKNLDALQETLLKFDIQQTEKVSERIKVVFSKLLEKTNHSREREINANKWKTVNMVMSSGIMITSFFTLPAPLTMIPTVLTGLQANFTAQQLVNNAYLLNIKAEVTRLDHELMKGKYEQSRLTQNSGNNVFSEIEEQIHLLAMVLEKQVINF